MKFVVWIMIFPMVCCLLVVLEFWQVIFQFQFSSNQQKSAPWQISPSPWLSYQVPILWSCKVSCSPKHFSKTQTKIYNPISQLHIHTNIAGFQFHLDHFWITQSSNKLQIFSNSENFRNAWIFADFCFNYLQTVGLGKNHPYWWL